ncbi:hypothetical protein B0A48_06532 [Cryoendolithus antarcticus]|uniref:SMP-30/Gluconolactonase/LRE-like region domain-containing protein n=1 Tax=Cryoendolithus antarcticus TaxID=1507870 RepID=A0A1V8TBU1_9PEZI|nr:hypothetical protein B0A48_06532 [Cryoendolithus antarcticus]
MPPEIKRYKITEPWLNTHCSLGEGPYWESSTNTVRFVDIIKKRLHFVPLSGSLDSLKTHQLDYSIGTTANIEGNDDELIVGGQLGYGIFTRSTGDLRWIQKFWNDEERKQDGHAKGYTKEGRMRANDGAIDKKGRYWVGTMNDPTLVDITDEGVLFRLDADLSILRVKEGVSIPNGTSWTSGNDQMYFTDSPTKTITLQPFDHETGKPEWEKAKVFFTCPVEGGVPDGHCQDAEGCFWIACFGTGRVYRVNVEGEIIAEIELPTRCVTCPALCGTELVITSASEEDPEKFPWSKEYGGAVFKIDVGVKGVPLNKFKMSVKA